MFHCLPLFLCTPWEPPESIISLGGSPPPLSLSFPFCKRREWDRWDVPSGAHSFSRAATAEDGSVPGLEVTAGWQALRNLWNVGLKVWGPFLLQEPPPLLPSFLFMTFHQLFLPLIQTIVFPG